MTMYDCKHCNRPVHDYITKGINEWMQDAVALLPDGTRLVGALDTEHTHTVGGRDVDADNTKWLHKICWENAARPEYDAYESPSKHRSAGSPEKQKELWVITPEVKDPAERTRLLAEGIAAYNQREFDQLAIDADDMIERDPRYMTEEHREFPHRQMFQVHVWSEVTTIYNRLTRTDVEFDGTKEEAEAESKRLFEEFLASDECKALQARRKELTAEWQAKQLAKFKEEGRYKVSYRPSRKGGDTINGRQCGRTMYYVQDELEYETVAEFDYSEEMAPKVYEAPDSEDYKGNHSAEWEARVEEFRDEADRIRKLADAECARLNQEWAAAGYPGKKDSTAA